MDSQPAIAICRGISGRYHCSTFGLSMKELQPNKEFNELSDGELVLGMWFRDVDGDGIAERLLINRVLSQKETKSKETHQPGSLVAKCYSMLSDAPTFEIKIPDASNLESVEWKYDHGVPISWLHVGDNRVVAIDWSQGRILTKTKADEEDSSNLPLICQSSSSKTLLAFPALDGVEFRPYGESPQDISKRAVVHDLFDPRRMRKRLMFIASDMTAAEWLLRNLRGGLALTLLVIIPIW